MRYALDGATSQTIYTELITTKLISGKVWQIVSYLEKYLEKDPDTVSRKLEDELSSVLVNPNSTNRYAILSFFFFNY